VGNLDVDPLFVGSGDYHLQSGSPVADNANAAVAPATDLDGVPRPVGAGVDRGAYEFRLPGVSLGGDGSLSGDPGRIITHTITITNDGDAQDAFDLSLSGQTWPSLLGANQVTLNAGASAQVILAVRVPLVASAGDSDTANVIVTSQRNALVVDSDNVDTVANLVPDVSLSPNNSAVANVDSTQLYHHQVTNNGNGSDTFGLGLVSSLGWTVQVDPATIVLNKGETTIVEVRVTVPTGSAGQTDTTTLTATSFADGSASDSATDMTTAVNSSDVALSPSNAASVMVGVQKVYTHTLTNNSDAADTLTLVPSSGQGWVVNVAPGSISLTASDSTQVVVTVTTPVSGANGLVDVTLIQAVSANGGAGFAATVADVTTLLNPASILLNANQSLESASGSSATYTHTLTNNGANVDTFSLVAISSQGWVAQLDKYQVTLSAGASTEIVLQVQVPGSAPKGTTDQTILTATSTYGPAANVSNTDTTTVTSKDNGIFLPLVARNS